MNKRVLRVLNIRFGRVIAHLAMFPLLWWAYGTVTAIVGGIATLLLSADGLVGIKDVREMDALKMGRFIGYVMVVPLFWWHGGMFKVPVGVLGIFLLSAEGLLTEPKK